MAGPGGPRDRGAVFLDLTDCVLLEATDVCTVDGVRGGNLTGEMIFLAMQGRINKTTTHVQTGYLFDTDGAAALITELLSLADRHSAELLDDLTRRLAIQYRDKNVDLPFLKAAIDNAIEAKDAHV